VDLCFYAIGSREEDGVVLGEWSRCDMRSLGLAGDGGGRKMGEPETEVRKKWERPSAGGWICSGGKVGVHFYKTTTAQVISDGGSRKILRSYYEDHQL
jgi:hypothetical protein